MAAHSITLKVFLVLSLLLLSGCPLHKPIEVDSSSTKLGDFIDVLKDSRMADDKAPLKLPASIAVVFVPRDNSSDFLVPETAFQLSAEKLKQPLIANPKYVNSVTIVPSEDLESKVSLQQIRDLYGTDIAILLSFKQDRRNQQSGAAAFADLTILGYFFVPGVKTITSTIVEGKVIHIPSNALIFKSTGTDQREAYSTTYGEKSEAVDQTIEGLEAATEDLGKKLAAVLSKFEQYDASRAISLSVLAAGDTDERRAGKVEPANDYWRRVDTYKSSGGGSFDFFALLMAAAAGIAARRYKR